MILIGSEMTMRLGLALVAVGISLYSIHVDRKFTEDADATAMCDIGI